MFSPRYSLSVITAVAVLIGACGTLTGVETIKLNDDAFHRRRIALLKVHQSNPKDVGVLYQLGVIYFRMDDLPTAKRYLEAANRESAKQPRAKVLLYLAQIYQRLRWSNRAMEYYRSAFKLDSALKKGVKKPFATLLAQHAARLVRYGQTELALKAADELLLLVHSKPGLSDEQRRQLTTMYTTWARRALRHPKPAKKRDVQRIVDGLERARRHRIDAPLLNYYLGVGYLLLKQDAARDAAFQRYLRSEQLGSNLIWLAKALRAMGETALAAKLITKYERDVESESQRGTLSELELQCYIELKRFADAVRVAGAWIDRQPERERSKLALLTAELFLDRGALDQALTLYRKAVALPGGGVNVLRSLLIQIRVGAHRRSLQDLLAKLIAEHSRPAWIRAQVGELYRQSGDDATALRFFSQALKHAKPHHRAHLMIARVRHYQGKPRERDDALRAWLAAMRHSPAAYGAAGDLLLALQEKELAFRYYQSAKGDRIETALLAARVHRLKGEFDKEQKLIGALLATVPQSDRSRALYLVGKRYVSLHDLARAKRYLDKLVATHAADPFALKATLLLGDIHCGQGHRGTSTGIVFYRQYLERVPTHLRIPELKKMIARVDTNSALGQFQGELYEQLFRLEPQPRGVYLKLGTRYLELGQTTKSNLFFNKFIGAAQNKTEAKLDVARRYIKKQRFREAVTFLKDLPSETVIRSIKNPGVHKGLGEHHQQQGDERSARRHFMIYLSKGKRTAYEAYRFGNQLTYRGMCDLALLSYRWTGADLSALPSPLSSSQLPKIEISGRLGTSSYYRRRYKYQMLFSLGSCYFKAGKHAISQTAFDEFIKTRKNAVYAYTRVGRFYYYAKHYRAAQKYYGQLFEKGLRGSSSDYRQLLEIYRLTGQLGKIRFLIRRYIERFPSRYSDPYHALARMLVRLDLHELAIELLREKLQKEPKDKKALVLLANALIDRGKVSEAARIFHDAYNTASSKPIPAQALRALDDAGQAFASRGHYKEALALFNVVLKTDPQRGETLLRRGEVYIALGLFEKARIDFVDTISFSTQSSHSVERIVRLLTAARQHSLAIAIVRHLIVLSPKKANARLQLGGLYEKNGQLGLARQVYIRYAQVYPRGVYHVARFFRRVGDTAMAKRYLIQGLTIPRLTNISSVLRELYGVLSGTGKLHELDGYLETYLLAARDKTQALSALASLFRSRNDHKRLGQILAKLKRLRTKADDRYQQAIMFFRKGELAGADRYFRAYVLGDTSTYRRYTNYRRHYRYRRHSYRYRSPYYISYNRYQGSAPARVCRFYRLNGKNEAALAITKLGLALNPFNSELYYEKAALELKLNRQLDAIDTVRKYLSQTGETDAARIRRFVTLLENHGLYKETEGMFQELVAQKRVTNSAVRDLLTFSRIRTLLRGKRFLDASNVSRRVARERTSKRAGLLLALAGLFKAFDRAEDVLRTARPVLQDTDFDQRSKALTFAVWALNRLDRTGEVETTVRTFLRHSESKADANYHAALLLIDHGYVEQAWKRVRVALELRSGHHSTQSLALRIAAAFPVADKTWQVVTAMRQRQSNPRAFWKSLVLFFSQRKRARLALRAIDQLLKLSPGAVVYLKDAGALALFEGELEAAEAYFTRFVEKHTNKGLAINEVATAYYRHVHYQTALKWYDRALSRNGKLETALIGRVLCYLQLDKPDEMVTAVRRYLQAAGRTARAHNVILLELLSHTQSPVTVLGALAKSGFNPRENTPAWSTLQLLLNTPTDGSRRFQKLLTRFSQGDAQTRSYLWYVAIAMIRSGNVTLGTRLFERYTVLYGSKLTLRWIVGWLRVCAKIHRHNWDNKKLSQLRQVALRLLKGTIIDGKSTLIDPSGVAGIEEATGHLSRAIWIFRRAIRHTPGKGGPYNDLAYLFSKKSVNLDEALRLVRKAMRLDPKHRMMYLDTEAWIHFKKGDFKRARDKILAAMRLANSDTPHVEYYYHLGEVYRKLGNSELARIYLRKAIFTAPGSYYARLSRRALAVLNLSKR